MKKHTFVHYWERERERATNNNQDWNKYVPLREVKYEQIKLGHFRQKVWQS